MKKSLENNQVKWSIAVFFLVSFLTHLPEAIQGFIEGWNCLH
jgi:hypothetical protein